MRGELIRGVLCETMPAGQRHGKIVADLLIEAGRLRQTPPAGNAWSRSDSGVLLERDPDTVREPDIAFTSVERLPLDADVPGYAEVVPDLVVEIVSPSDSRRGVNDKARMWLSHGVRLVWVVHPETRTVDVHRADHDAATLGEDDALDGMDVLPGFSCAVKAVFGA